MELRLERFFLFFCLILCCCAAAHGASVLPRAGFGVSSLDALQAPEIGKHAAGKILFLPAQKLDLSALDRTLVRVDRALIDRLPADAEVYVRLQLVSEGAPAGLSETSLREAAGAAAAQMPLGSSRVKGLLIEISDQKPQSDLLYFTAAYLVTQVKAANKDARVLFFFAPGFIQNHAETVKRLVNYADGICSVFGPLWRKDHAWVAENAFNKPFSLRVVPLPGQDPYSQFVSALLDASGTAVESVWIDQADPGLMQRASMTYDFLSRSIPETYSPDQKRAAPFSIQHAPNAVLEQKFFFDTVSSAAAAIVTGGKELRVSYPEGAAIECFDPVAGTPIQPQPAVRAGGRIEQACAFPAPYALLTYRKLGKQEERAVTSLEVSAGAELSVEEIVARWQQFQEWQRARLRNSVADCFMNLHFEATTFHSGFELSLRMKQFADNKGLVEFMQTDTYIDGLKFGNNTEFPLPQLEPDKVVARPLELKLNEKYSYKLLGTDTINGTLCYVVGISPAVKNESLYTGKVWIDGTSFRQVRLELAQAKGQGNMISNSETQDFDWVSDNGGERFNVIRSLSSQQTVNAAGRNFILERRYTYSAYEMNVADFDQRLASARSSDKPMFRETDAGLRQLKKKGNQRVLQDMNKRMRSIVAGVLYDGSYDFPIPLLGLSLVDFHYRQSNSQLSVFFAGPLLAGNLSRQWTNGFRLGLDLSLSGLPETNRVYNADVERKGEALYSFEESVGPRASWQATTNLNIAAAVYLAYDLFIHDTHTDQNFQLPRNGASVTPNLELKYASNGYIVTGNVLEGMRIGWRQFGFPDQPAAPLHSNFLKYSLEASKTFYLGNFTEAGPEVSYFGGDKLDRFSRWRGSFITEPRIKGIPGGLDAFDDVTVAGLGGGFNAMDFIRFQASYNHAWGRNRDEWKGYRQYDGLDFETATAGPWNSYVQGIVTYALRGSLPRYSTRWGVYLLIFKPLG